LKFGRKIVGSTNFFFGIIANESKTAVKEKHITEIYVIFDRK